MASNEDVLIAFNATDSVSSVAQGINSSVSSMGSGIRGTVSQLSQAFGGLDSVISGAFASMTGKSVYDIIIGTSSRAETNDILLANMAQTSDGADKLKEHVDDVTNTSLMSMQDMIPALNGIKAAVGANEDEIYNITDGVANFGSYVYALTGSQAQASTAMFDLSKGIKGLYASLDQYGITEDSLMATGLWSGKEEDVEGYIAAVNEVTGSTEELMDTNSGLDARIGKMFSAAGKKIGQDTLPVVKDLKNAFLDLNKSTGGELAKDLLYLGGAFSVFQTGVTTVGQIANSFNSMIAIYDMVKGAIMGSVSASLEDAGAKTAQAGATATATASEEAKTTVTQMLAQSQWENALASAGITEEELAQAAAMTGSTSVMEIKETASMALSSENMALIASEMGITEAELSSAIAHAGTTSAVVAETGANAGLTSSIWAMTTAFLTNPVFLIVAGFVALAVAVYEVGKGFGWWTDVGTMLESMSAGVQRLWSAFMNNPNVQATIQNIQNAFNDFINFLSPVVAYLQESWVSMFPDDGNEVDVIRMIIDAFGALGDIGGKTVNAIVKMFQVWYTMASIIVGFLVSGFDAVVNTFQGIYNAVQRVIAVFSNMNTLSNTLKDVAIHMVMNFVMQLLTLRMRVVAVFNQVLGAILSFGSNALNRAMTVGSNIFNGVVNNIIGMPGRVRNIFNQGVHAINSYVGQAYSSATTFGMNIVNGAISYVSQLPGKIGEEFAKIPSQILSQAGAIGSAVNDVFSNLVDTALSALGIASPGFVQRAVATEFAQIPGRINESAGSVNLASKNFANGIVTGFGSVSNDLDLSNSRFGNKGYIDTFNQIGKGYSPNVRKSGDTTIIIQEGAVQLDSRNLTTKECNQIMITALESLDDIEEIKVKERDENNA